jgi:hypothetical protein
MSAGAALGTVIGLVFLFGVTALLCSAICEAIANVLQMRAKYLLRGLRTMLDSTVTKTTSAQFDGSAAAAVASPVTDEPMRSLHRRTTDPQAAMVAANAVNTMAMAAGVKAASVPDAETATPSGATPDAAAREGDQAGTPTSSGELPAELQQGGLTLAMFGHPLLRSLQSSRVGLLGGTHRNPSYLSPATFSRVLIDTLVPDEQGETTLAAVRATVEKLPEGLPAKKSLLSLLRRSGDDLTRFESLVEQWYDEHMSRMSGWYKRWAKLVLIIVATVVAILANVDTIQVARQLYVNEPVRAAVLSQVNDGNLCQNETDPAQLTTCAKEAMAKLEASGLPLWWSSGTKPDDATDWAVKILGFLLTAFAVSFGAPFWFDALSKLGSLRTAGPKPERLPGRARDSPEPIRDVARPAAEPPLPIRAVQVSTPIRGPQAEQQRKKVPGMSAEIVYRWRVDPKHEQEFFAAAQARMTALTEVTLTNGPLRPRLLQPAIGPSPLVWELRIEVNSMKDVGDLLDRLSITPADSEMSLVFSLTDMPGAVLLGDGPPFYRVWHPGSRGD